MKVKLLKYIGDWSTSDLERMVVVGMTDWEEVDSQTYHLLRDWAQKKMAKSGYNGEKWMLVEQPDQEFNIKVKEVLAWKKEEEEKVEKARKEREAKKKAKELAKRKMKEAEEKALLEELEKKYRSSTNAKAP